MSLCPEVDVASQGDTIEEARANLQAAVELFYETASTAEIEERLHGEVYVTSLEVAIGQVAHPVRPRGGTYPRGQRLRAGSPAGQPP